MSKTSDDEKIIEKATEGGGDPVKTDQIVTRGSPLPRHTQDALIKGLTASGMNNTDAIKQARWLETRSRLGRR